MPLPSAQMQQWTYTSASKQTDYPQIYHFQSLKTTSGVFIGVSENGVLLQDPSRAFRAYSHVVRGLYTPELFNSDKCNFF